MLYALCTRYQFLWGTRYQFREDNFSTNQGVACGFRMIRGPYIHCTFVCLFLLSLYQLHLRSSGIRYGKLGTHVIQYVLISYLFYISEHTINSLYVSIKSPNISHHPVSPFLSIRLFSMSVSLFLFCKWDNLKMVIAAMKLKDAYS